MLKVTVVFGTRPEAIKMAPSILAMQQDPTFEVITIVTGQHREMLTNVLQSFNIKPDYDLNIMQPGQTLTDITTQILSGLEPILSATKPDYMLVHGDTTTALASTLAAFYQQIPVGHVEAGLRTGNLMAPFPEEMNRQVIDRIATHYFVPTAISQANLLAENIKSDKIFITGNTAIDALNMTIDPNFNFTPILGQIKFKRMILFTMHRRENLGKPMADVFEAINQITARNSYVAVIFPVHLNPKIQQLAHNKFANNPQVHLINPQDVIPFHNLLARAYLVLTDSGGLQEEAPALGKPVLLLRESTERPEGINEGVISLVGIEPQRVIKSVQMLLDDEEQYNQMATGSQAYGNGQASQKIIEVLKNQLQVLHNNG